MKNRSNAKKEKEKKKKRKRIKLIVKLLTRLRLQFSHLNEHKFRHGFGDTRSPMCECGNEVKTTEHLPLCCDLYSLQRLELFENLGKVVSSFLELKC